MAEGQAVVYQNKDITAKAFAERFPKEAFLMNLDSEEIYSRLTGKIQRFQSR